MNEFQKIIWRWNDRNLMISNGPARGMLLIRHDNGTAVSVVIRLHAFDALWNAMKQASNAVNLNDGEE